MEEAEKTEWRYARITGTSDVTYAITLWSGARASLFGHLEVAQHPNGPWRAVAPEEEAAVRERLAQTMRQAG